MLGAYKELRAGQACPSPRAGCQPGQALARSRAPAAAVVHRQNFFFREAAARPGRALADSISSAQIIWDNLPHLQLAVHGVHS